MKNKSEDDEQAKFFSYCKVACRCGWKVADKWLETGTTGLSETGIEPLPQLAWIHSIPNGGSRDSNRRVAAIRGSQMKRTGLRAGVADIFLPYPCGGQSGCYIEMKRESNRPKRLTSKGGLSDEQIAFGRHVRDAGYQWFVAYGCEDAVAKLQEYCGYQREA